MAQLAHPLTPPHLGGHHGITHVDAPVLAYLQGRFGIRTMVDVGCGPGGMRHVADALGIAWEGIDGDPAVAQPDVLIHDYTTGPLHWSAVDLVWCVEFVEHVEAPCVPHFLATFAAGRVLFLTHATPGQGGHHHVNEQPAGYWHETLALAGWRYDADTTASCRQIATDVYTKATGMVWTR